MHNQRAKHRERKKGVEITLETIGGGEGKPHNKDKEKNKEKNRKRARRDLGKKAIPLIQKK